MQRSSLLATLALTSGCHVRPESLLPLDSATHAARSEHLTGSRGTFVVFGDVSSVLWPAFLQELLDAHAGRPGFYRLSATPKTTNGASSALGRDPALPPETVLCMLSLAGVGDERGPVKSEHDMVGAEMGADALEEMALGLCRAGAERVVFATPLFTPGAGPEAGLERVAIERLLARGHDFIAAGPDVFRASKRYYPDAYLEGGQELNEFGQKMLAEEWYRWLAGPEAREEVVEGLYATYFDLDALREAFARNLQLPTP